MKKLITLLTILALGAGLAFAQSEPVGDPDQTKVQTWEQKMDAVKECAGDLVQTQEQIKTLEQLKEQAETDAEKAQVQEQTQGNGTGTARRLGGNRNRIYRILEQEKQQSS